MPRRLTSNVFANDIRFPSSVDTRYYDSDNSIFYAIGENEGHMNEVLGSDAEHINF